MTTKQNTLLERYKTALTLKDAHSLELCRQIEEELAGMGTAAEVEGKKILHIHIGETIKELEKESGAPGMIDILEDQLLELADFIGHHENQFATN